VGAYSQFDGSVKFGNARRASRHGTRLCIISIIYGKRATLASLVQVSSTTDDVDKRIRQYLE
jgi:hypothetical protein